MDVCLRVLKESNKSRFDSYSRQEQCIDHVPCYLSGLSRAHFFPTTFLEKAVCVLLSVLAITVIFILGDPGTVSRAGEKARRKFSSNFRRAFPFGPTDCPWVSEDE